MNNWKLTDTTDAARFYYSGDKTKLLTAGMDDQKFIVETNGRAWESSIGDYYTNKLSNCINCSAS
jgi:hypothetical protein